jgi:hypothetical protein
MIMVGGLLCFLWMGRCHYDLKRGACRLGCHFPYEQGEAGLHGVQNVFLSTCGVHSGLLEELSAFQKHSHESRGVCVYGPHSSAEAGHVRSLGLAVLPRIWCGSPVLALFFLI